MAGRKMKNRSGSGFRATPVKVFLSGVSCRIHYVIQSELRLEAAISEDSARRDADMSWIKGRRAVPSLSAARQNLKDPAVSRIAKVM